MYAAFGFQVSARRPNLPDHISAELEFVAALLAKEAYALDQGWYPQAKLTRQARRKFIRENLAQWLPAFVERLEQHRRLPFYPAVAALVLALLAIEQTPDDHHRG
jgi:TorA maturation chaperone TorD